MKEHIREQLKKLRLPGALRMMDALVATGADKHMNADEFVSQIIDAECEDRHARSVTRRTTSARFRQKAYLEQLDTTPGRGIDKKLLALFATGNWIRDSENILITGATGTGKSYFASALGHLACSKEYSALYFSCTKLIRALREAQQGNTFGSYLKKISRIDVLIIDDFGLESFNNAERRWLFEIIEDRHQESSTVIASQYPLKVWHTLIGDPTIADAILDRIIHHGHTINLEKEERSRRANKA